METIIKWNADLFGVEMQTEDEHFIIEASPSKAMSWHEAVRYYEDPWRVPTRKLPTKNQLKIVAEHIEDVNKHLNANGGYELRCLHWTNEEYDELRARGVSVIDGYTCADYKDLDYYVRAVTDMKV